MDRFLPAVAIALLGCCLVGESASAVDRIEEFNRARRGIQAQLRSKQPDHRVEAVQKLQQFPVADAVRLIIKSLDDENAEVSDTAYDILLKMSNNQEVCDTLLQTARKSVGPRGDAQAVVPLVSVLLCSNLPSVRRDVDDLFDKAATARNGAEFAVALADELGRHHEPADVMPLTRLADTRIFADNIGLRRAVVQALTQIHTAEGIGALITVMDKVQGEALADAAEHLVQVTKQIFGLDAAAWQRWWDDNKTTFKYPKDVAIGPPRSVSLTSTSGYYYGLPLFAEKLVFVLDTSGSMNGARIVAAQRELTRAIAGLPDHAQFGVVVFNRGVDVWQKHLTKATEQSKEAAIRFVNSQGAHFDTASYDALETAFAFDTEAIYFLSDGAPTSGKIVAPVDIIAAITTANKTRRVSVYTIGIGAGFPGSPLDVFMRTLAEQNMGQYRRVDE